MKGLRGKGVKTEFQFMVYGQQQQLNLVMFSGEQYYSSSGYSMVVNASVL